MTLLRVSALAVLLVSAPCFSASGQAHSNEQRTEQAFAAARAAGAPSLYAFLRPFPKGADLHMHLSGAVYAETFVEDAVKLGLCLAPVTPGSPATPVAQGMVQFVLPSGAACATGSTPVSEAVKNPAAYDAMIDSFSMRAFAPSEGINGHDQFFNTFSRVNGLDNVQGEWLDEVVKRAAAQNEEYLEIMHTPTTKPLLNYAATVGWPAGSEKDVTPATLTAQRAKMAGALFNSMVATDKKDFADIRSAFNQLEHCPAPNTQVDPASPCSVHVHWIFQVLRGNPPEKVFAMTMLAFEVASSDPDVVGVNFVMPEDGRYSMRDYHIQMQMLDYFHDLYPKVRVTLHAGELAQGMVPPDGMRFHIREAIDLGHAERIGHGVDLMYEDRPADLLKQMAAAHTMVEVNLTSNDVILGVKGADHPLAAYRAAHVPFALSTDDEGVSRIDLTHEYVRAVTEQGLSYSDLKQSARTSLEHSFMPGASLWTAEDNFSQRNAACAGPILANSTPAGPCRTFLDASERAAEQWELERRFAAFEAAAH